MRQEKCAEIQDKLFDLLGGGSSAEEVEIIHKHLDTCSDCQTAWVEAMRFEEFWNRLRGEPELLPSVRSADPALHLPTDAIVDYALSGGENLSEQERAWRLKHFGACAQCRYALVALRAALRDAESGYLPPPPLSPPETGVLPSFVMPGRELVRLQLSLVGLAIHVKHSTARSSMRLRGARDQSMDRSSDAQPSLSLFSHDFPECQMELAVTVVSPNTCQMTFTLTDPETGQRLPGAWVRLFDRRSQPGVMEAPEITSLPAKNGVVQFIDRPLGRYLIEITRQDRLLGEIALELQAEGES